MTDQSEPFKDALRHLAGEGDPAEGLRLLQRASAAGEGDASALLAALSALGVGAPPDFPQTFGLLAVAARQGSERARRQLHLLSGGDPGSDDWAGLASGVDLDAWLRPAQKLSLCEAPRIRRLPGFLPLPVCEWLIGIGRARIAPAEVFDAETGRSRRAETRSNSAFKFELADLDVVTVLVRAKIAVAAGVPVGALETTQLLHYAEGQRFERHYDYLDVSRPGYAQEAAQHGQRIATVLVYLNADYEGGATEFSRVGVEVKGEAGDGLMFANVDRAGAPDPLTLHRGAPPTSGEKWLLSQWVRDRVSGG